MQHVTLMLELLLADYVSDVYVWLMERKATLEGIVPDLTLINFFDKFPFRERLTFQISPL